MKTPILGSAYVARSVNAADNRMVNLFPEIIPEGGKEPAFLSRAPGLRLLATVVNGGPIRGLWVLGSFLYIASGTKLYRCNTSYAITELGNISGTGPVSMSDNNVQVFVACNGSSYIYNSTTGVFSQITDVDFPGAVTVGYIDGYFVFNQPNSNIVWTSELYDGLIIDPLDKSTMNQILGNVLAVFVDHREVWIFGNQNIQVLYDAGNTNFPLDVIQGAYLEIGLAAAYSLAKLDNAIFWLGQDARGQGIVYRANGYIGQRISTHAIEWQIQQYSTISDAIGYAYQQDGHGFYVLVFPTANTTWVYDVATQSWHERAEFNNGNFTRHRGNCHAFFNNENIVGDFENGNLYAFDLDVYADNGAEQKWLRSWRALGPDQNNLKRSIHHSLQLDCESGIGLVTGQGSDPQVMLRWSNDGGHTWSAEHWASVGAIGQYGQRVIWRRLGATMKIRDRIYEISGTDPVKISIVGAELIASATNA